ncbi:hypothetical protein TNCV_335131 [Trichonephila clavipes]|nr:hypothetical protein TNCV_335131 [Trichonephila clavipes]
MRNYYQHESKFESARNVTCREKGLSLHNIATCIGQNPTTVMRIGDNQWIQENPIKPHEDPKRPKLLTNEIKKKG